MSDLEAQALAIAGKPQKRFYRLSTDVFTYGRPGEFAPRVKRSVKVYGGSNRKSYEYRRIRGGEIPADPAPEPMLSYRTPNALVSALLAADEIPEA